MSAMKTNRSGALSVFLRHRGRCRDLLQRACSSTIASIAGVTACGLDPGTDPSLGSTEQGSTIEDTSSVTGEEFAIRTIDATTNSAVGAVPAASFPCRKVTASSIPIFATARVRACVAGFLLATSFNTGHRIAADTL